MDVSKRRILQKHLEPARPLRRCLNAAAGKQAAPRSFSVCSAPGCSWLTHSAGSLTPSEPSASVAPCVQAVQTDEDHEVRNERTPGNVSYFKDIVKWTFVVNSYFYDCKRPDQRSYFSERLDSGANSSLCFVIVLAAQVLASRAPVMSGPPGRLWLSCTRIVTDVALLHTADN